MRQGILASCRPNLAIRLPRLFKANRFDRRPAGMGVVGTATTLLLPDIRREHPLMEPWQSGSFFRDPVSFPAIEFLQPESCHRAHPAVIIGFGDDAGGRTLSKRTVAGTMSSCLPRYRLGNRLRYFRKSSFRASV
jgi:hypothetical protein